MQDRALDALILPESRAKEPDTFRVEGYTVIHSADAQKDDKGKPVQTFTGVTLILNPFLDLLVHEIIL